MLRHVVYTICALYTTCMYVCMYVHIHYMCTDLTCLLLCHLCSEPAPRKIRLSFVRQPIQLHHPSFLFCLLAGQRWQSARTPRAWSSSPSGQTSLATGSTSTQRRLARVRKLSAGYKIHKYKYTNTKTQIQKHIYKNTNTKTQIHKYKHKYKNTNTKIIWIQPPRKEDSPEWGTFFSPGFQFLFSFSESLRSVSEMEQIKAITLLLIPILILSNGCSEEKNKNNSNWRIAM